MKSMILPKEIVPQLPEQVKDQSAYAGLCESMAVFDPTGWALEDQAALGMMLDYADEMGIGQQLVIEQLSVDPQDPYELANYSITQSISQTGRI